MRHLWVNQAFQIPQRFALLHIHQRVNRTLEDRFHSLAQVIERTLQHGIDFAGLKRRVFMRQMFEEVNKLVFLEADPELVERLLEVTGR